VPEQRLPAEWEPQDAVLLTWPHRRTDLEPLLEEVVPLYEALVAVIVDYADLIIAAPEDELEEIRQRLENMTVPLEDVHLFPVVSNDSWARDHGPLIVETSKGLKVLDFQFNGWGGKFEYQLDNAITTSLHLQGAFPDTVLEAQPWVLEGGSIEVDGRGTLMTTSSCLLNANRNPDLSRQEIEARLKAAFRVRKINWLEHGYLAGDATDSHIDTLARLCPDNVIVYMQCDDPDDEHYAELRAMEAELAELTDADGKAYKLLPLPWPGPVLNDEARRLTPCTT
jgi:agmatine/peptidylarginine deiminase